jgi:manganese/zinc/iron transport system permease protein
MTHALAFIWVWSLDGWIVLAAALCAMACALPGNFLVLRRMSMMGDAISHAVLPGLAIAFLVSGSRNSLPMFLGAAIVGVLTAVFTQWVSSLGRLDESASMGVVFTTLFALGLILIVRAADHVDLDPGCVLHGVLESVPVDDQPLFGIFPRVMARLGAMFLINAIVIVLLYKELKITSFDPDLATSIGINATLIHYLLMIMVAATTVASFEAVGSILVVAMLIVPPATAYLLTNRLSVMIVLSVIIAAACAILGHLAAITVPEFLGFPGDTLTSGMMAVVAGLFLTLAVFFSPRQGLVFRWIHSFLLSLRIASEDLLGLLYRLEELHGETAAAPQLLRQARGIGPLLGMFAVRDLLRRNELARDDGHLRLTQLGRDRAKTLVRAHRLWEGYLQKHLKLPVDHLHRPAEQLEHVTSPTMRDRLADSIVGERVISEQVDPQGKPIPPR